MFGLKKNSTGKKPLPRIHSSTGAEHGAQQE
jgi:hypothetical protein